MPESTPRTYAFCRLIMMGVVALVTCIANVLPMANEAAAAVDDTKYSKEVLELFEQMFGKEFRQARLVRDKDRQIDLTRKLVRTAKKNRQPVEFYAILLDKAFEIGSRNAASYRDAANAMKLMSEALPERRVDALENLLSLYMQVYRKMPRGSNRFNNAGNAAAELLLDIGYSKQRKSDFRGASAAFRQSQSMASQTKNIKLRDRAKLALSGVTSAMAFQRKIAIAKAKLAEIPDDKGAASVLTNAYLIEQDDPHRAAEFAEIALDEQKQELLLLAVFEPGYGKPAQYLDLAMWYLDLANQAPPARKAPMLVRAKLYGEYFLDHIDGSNLKGRLIVDKITRDLSAMGYDEERIGDRIAKLEARFVDAGVLATNTTPDKPDTHDVPDVPDTPDTTPDKPDTTDKPDKPVTTPDTTPDKPKLDKTKPRKPGKTGSKLKKLPPPKYDSPDEVRGDEDWKSRPSIFDF